MQIRRLQQTDRTNNSQNRWFSAFSSCHIGIAKMANINYLLFESAAGYAVFEVVNQADIVGLRNKEVQDSLKNLSTFTKYVKLVNFTPYRCVLMETMASYLRLKQLARDNYSNYELAMRPRPSKISTCCPRELCPTT